MKPFMHFIAFIIALSCITSACSEHDSIQSTSQVIQHTTDALEMQDPVHYEAQMRFKESGGDTFEIRNFSISYKSNKANPLYGYDWQISEEVDSGYMYTWMTLQESYYVIFEGTKAIGQRNLPKTIDLGSYPEYIRDFLILKEVFSTFSNVPPEDIMMRDTGNTYVLIRQVNDIVNNQLTVSKVTYLPIQFINTITDTTFDLPQITEINFFYSKPINTIPDTAFSIDHYYSLGYTLHQNQKPESSEQDETNTLSHENIEFLLNYPFVTETGDSTTLKSFKAWYIVLDFWYASCMPCLKALPEINQLAQDYEDAGLVVLGINCIDKGISSTLASKLRAKNITIPLLFGSGDLLQSLKINSFPSYVLINPDRQVEFIQGDIEEIKNLLSPVYDK